MPLKYYLLLLFLACAATTAMILSITGTMISISLSPMFIIITASCLSILTWIWNVWDNLWGKNVPAQQTDNNNGMQDALLKIRGLEAELISMKAQLDAAQSKEKAVELTIQEFDAVTALAQTVANMSDTSAALKAASEANDKSHSTSQIIIENQITPLQHELNALNKTIQSLNVELEEKKALIEAFQPQFIAQQTEIDLLKRSLAEISVKIVELTNLSVCQKKNINLLNNDNEQLTNTIEALTNALEETMSPAAPCSNKLEIDAAAKPAYSFF